MSEKIVPHRADVLVVGGGAAGAMAAIRAKECGADVLLVDKSVFGASGCAALASGAYITYMPGDDLAFHLAGRGVLANQTQAIKAIYATYDVLKILESWGVRFLKERGSIWRGRWSSSSSAPVPTNRRVTCRRVNRLKQSTDRRTAGRRRIDETRNGLFD